MHETQQKNTLSGPLFTNGSKYVQKGKLAEERFAQKCAEFNADYVKATHKQDLKGVDAFVNGITVNVKHNLDRKYSNFFLERRQLTPGCTPAWLEKDAAEWFAFYYEAEDRFLCFKRTDLIRWCDELGGKDDRWVKLRRYQGKHKGTYELITFPLEFALVNSREISHIRKSTAFTMIDIFPGIGGMRTGIEQAAKEFEREIKCVLLLETDRYALRSYKENYDEDCKISTFFDLTTKDIRKLGEIDIISMSLGYKLRYYLRDIYKLIKLTKPKLVVIEGSSSLYQLYNNRDSYLISIMNELKLYEYNVYSHTIDSTHFNLPQKRRHVYTLAFRKDNDKKYSFPSPFSNVPILADILEPVEQISGYYFLTQREYDDILLTHENNSSRWKERYFKIVTPESQLLTLLDTYKCLKRSLILTPNRHPSGRIGVRRLTNIEYLRAQGFPDDYKLANSIKRNYIHIARDPSVTVIKEIMKKAFSMLV